jgi:hypothetical protein
VPSATKEVVAKSPQNNQLAPHRISCRGTALSDSCSDLLSGAPRWHSSCRPAPKAAESFEPVDVGRSIRNADPLPWEMLAQERGEKARFKLLGRS